MYVGRTCDFEIVQLTAFCPGIPRLVTLFVALSVIPVERAGSQGQRQDAGMRMPSSVAPGRKSTILKKDRGWPLCLHKSPELAVASAEVSAGFDIGILIPRGKDRKCKVKDGRRPGESTHDTCARQNTNDDFPVDLQVLPLSFFGCRNDA